MLTGAAAQAARVDEGRGKRGSVKQLARGLKSAGAHRKRNTANLKQPDRFKESQEGRRVSRGGLLFVVEESSLPLSL